MKISAQTVAYSQSPQGHKIWTGLLTFPRHILSELNTHRMLSKNSASSRAIPTSKMISSIINDPFIPIAWQKEHKGMQGNEYITEENIISIRKNVWLKQRNSSINTVKSLMTPIYQIEEHGELPTIDGGTMIDEDINMAKDGEPISKQIANRLLEPFMYHTVLITGTEWGNFFELRCPQYVVHIPNGEDQFYRSRKDLIALLEGMGLIQQALRNRTEVEWLQENKGQAEIHMMALAESIWDAMNGSVPKQLQAGEWHIPFEDKIDGDSDRFVREILEYRRNRGNHVLNLNDEFIKEKIKVSTAFAARTSYTVVGDEKEIGYDKLIGIHDKLINAKPFHASPTEHCARTMTDYEYERFIKGEMDNRYSDYRDSYNTITDKMRGWCYNYRGFIQYRYIIENQK